MNGYVAGGWGATALIVALYAWRVLHRGRVLARSLPDGKKRWPDGEKTWPDGEKTWPDGEKTWPDGEKTGPDREKTWR